MRAFLSTIFCAWLTWQMTIVDREYKHLPVDTTPTTQADCLTQLQHEYARYEKRVGGLRWYAEMSHPNYWYGCFPSDYDPRDDENRGKNTSVQEPGH